MSLDFDKFKDELTPLIKDFVTASLDDLKDDAQEYGKEIGKDLVKYIYKVHIQGEEADQEVLDELKLQMRQRAIINRIRINNRMMETLEKSLIIAAKIAIAALAAA